MTNDDGLIERRRTLEEEFFARREAETWARLRSRAEEESRRRELAAISGIRDEALLDRLFAHGIDADTFPALALVPVVEVAWADGDVAPAERVALLRAAADHGLQADDPAHGVFARWLAERPPDALVGLWKQYVAALCADLDTAAQMVLADEVLGRARAVAEAAGGFLGLGNRVSAAERRVLDELRRAIGDPV